MLKKNGWEVKRVAGSHFIMYKEGQRIVPVPCHNKDLKKGTLSAILKQTGLDLP